MVGYQRDLFHPSDEFFIIDSHNLSDVKTRLYGYFITDSGIVDKNNFRNDIEPTSEGAYVLVKNAGTAIHIVQDNQGSYGLYYYAKDDRFVISNSFQYLADYLKGKVTLSFNKEFALYFATANLCSEVFDHTLINEIRSVNRDTVEIDTKQKTFEIKSICDCFHSIKLDSAEAFEQIDRWYCKWASIISGLVKCDSDITLDLSGGFDSRIILSLFLSPKVDTDKVYIYSANDHLHVHDSDYEIANDIAKAYGLKLNQNKKKHKEDDWNYCSIRDILNISNYVKSGLTKQLYHVFSRSRSKKYRFTGEGGGCIRGYKGYKTPDDMIKAQTDRIQFKDKNNSYRVGKAIRSEITHSVEEVYRKYESAGIKINEEDILHYNHIETRSHNHHGKSAVERYFGNTITMRPLVDSLLMSIDSMPRILPAVIFARFAPKLLDIKVEGGRSLTKNEIELAMALNAKYPPKQYDYDVKISDDPMEPSIVNQKTMKADVNKYLLAVLASEDLKAKISKVLPPEIYDNAVNKTKNTKYNPIAEAHCLFAIYKAMSDAEISRRTQYNMLGILPSDTYDRRLNIIPENSVGSQNARIDVKMDKKDSNFEIKSISDPNAEVSSPKWMNEKDTGVMILSSAGNLEFEVESKDAGTLSLLLRSPDNRVKGAKHPMVVSYNKLTIDGQTAFDDIVACWHDDPFTWKMPLKANARVRIAIIWDTCDI